jgi:hypothetical protein
MPKILSFGGKGTYWVDHYPFSLQALTDVPTSSKPKNLELETPITPQVVLLGGLDSQIQLFSLKTPMRNYPV